MKYKAATFDSLELHVEYKIQPRLQTWDSNKITKKLKDPALTPNLGHHQKSKHMASTEIQSKGYGRLLSKKSNLTASVWTSWGL